MHHSKEKCRWFRVHCLLHMNIQMNTFTKSFIIIVLNSRDKDCVHNNWWMWQTSNANLFAMKYLGYVSECYRESGLHTLSHTFEYCRMINVIIGWRYFSEDIWMRHFIRNYGTIAFLFTLGNIQIFGTEGAASMFIFNMFRSL